MAFHSDVDIQNAMTWFQASPDEVPYPELVELFEDDREHCVDVQFGDSFRFTFWWMRPHELWSLAQGDVRLVRERLLNEFEKMLDERKCSFDGGYYPEDRASVPLEGELLQNVLTFVKWAHDQDWKTD